MTPRVSGLLLLPVLALTGLTTTVAFAGELTVTAVQPASHALIAPVGTSISITFDEPVMVATVTAANVKAFGRWSGAAEGALSLSNGDRTVTLTPSSPFSAGESVMVILSNQLRAASGSFLRSAGYSYQFWTAADAATRSFTQVQTFSTRTTPGQSSRAYGGIGSDIDGDGNLDITIVNEDTNDLRVFLNQGGGTGQFDPFLVPPSGTGTTPSPSEPADFNGDGNTDIAVANTNSADISILLGNGDGTFGPEQRVATGGSNRGIAVLDADGDGDVDVVSASNGTGLLWITLNNGAGVFGVATSFDSTGSGEWALAAAEMNEDGIMDLVVGTRNDQRIIVMTGNGDGTFTFASSTSAGGRPWMIVCGDVNGDGLEDVASANSQSNNGSILVGDGQGNLANLLTVATDNFPLATDVGDLDGDGDLDWLTSCFGGDWQLFVNNGSGVFTFDQEFNAPQAASCSLPIDADGDGDLDLALIDELADVVEIWLNGDPPCPEDITGDGTVNVFDLLAILAAWGPCPGCPADVTGDGTVNVFDLLAVLGAWGPC